MVELGVPPGIVSAEAALAIEGEPQPQLNAGLLALMVEETSEGLYRCEARFGNWGGVGTTLDYLYFNRELLNFDKELTVSLGHGETQEEVFRGRISALEGQFLPGEEPPQIVILAEDAAQSLRMTCRTRTFESVPDAVVFETIAQDHRLQHQISIQGPTHAVVAQLNQSDLAFLRERARRLGAEIWIQGQTLHVQDRLNRQQGSGDLTLVWQRGLQEFSVIADTANQYTEVIVSGWDTQAKDVLSYAATDSVLRTELGGDESGAVVVQGFKEYLGRDRTDRITQLTPLTTREAQSLAEATFRAQARRFVVGKGTAQGDPRIRVGRAIALEGLGPLFSGTYYVTETRHLFSRGEQGGYTTEFVVERAGIGKVTP
jgi:phage protein D